MGLVSSTIGRFLGLSDTPSTYIGQTGLVLAVNAGETALEFISPSAGSINFSYNVVATELTIPANQQMITYQNITLNANLILNGDLVLID